MTNLLGLGVRRGQRGLGKQNHSASVTPGATSGTPSLSSPAASHQGVSQAGPMGPSSSHPMRRKPGLCHITWMQLSPCPLLLNQCLFSR